MNCMEKLENHQCRTCYNATKGLRLLKNLTKCISSQEQKSYAELLREVTSINIMEESYKELPQFICDSCSRKLKASHAFIQQTHEVNKRLMAMLIGRDERNIQLDCLQEAQVDIQSCLEIKMEHDEAVAEEKSEAKCHVVLKLEEPEQFPQINHINVDEMREKDDGGGSVELVTLKETSDPTKSVLNDTEKLNTEDILNVEAAKYTDNSITDTNLQTDLLIDSEDDDDEDNRDDDEDYQDNDWEDLDWQKEKKAISNSSNKKDDKKISKKSKKSDEKMENPNDDDDVAVPCSQCNKIFSNSKALARHQRTSHIPEDQKCTCPLCFRKFSRSCNMYTHMRTFHGPDTVPLIRKPSTQERIFQCDKCPRNYTKKKHLNIHIKNKHSQENADKEKITEKAAEDDNKEAANDETPVKPNKPKRYEVRSLCSICGSSFSSKTHLIVHMRRHTGERPFKCDLCDRAYPRISELTCHRRIHTGEKPFACKICGKTFRVSSKMTTHMRSHTDIRPYKCTQCERSFKYSKDLSIHFRIHTGERPYCCNVCGSTFTQSNTLKAHRVKLGHMDSVVDNTNNLV